MINNFKNSYFLLILCLYLYIYNPIFQPLGFGAIKFLYIPSLIYLPFSSSRFFNYYKNYFIYFLVLFFYMLLLSIGGNTVMLIKLYTIIVFIIESFILPFFICSFFCRILLKSKVLNIISNLGFIASLITIFLFVFPEINSLVRHRVIVDYLDVASEYEWNNRGFTIAESSSFIYGLIQGVIFSITLFYYNGKLKIIFLISLFFSVLVNARIGFVPIIFSIIICLPRIFNVKTFLVFVLTFCLFFNIDLSKINNNESFRWGLAFFSDSISLIFDKEQKDSSNYDSLLNDMLFFPDDSFSLFFGKRIDVYRSTEFFPIAKTSDIGYVRQVFWGGLFYLVLLILFYMILLRDLKHVDWKFRICLLFTLVISNYKGNVFLVSVGFVRMVMLIVTCRFLVNRNYILNE